MKILNLLEFYNTQIHIIERRRDKLYGMNSRMSAQLLTGIKSINSILVNMPIWDKFYNLNCVYIMNKRLYATLGKYAVANSDNVFGQITIFELPDKTESSAYICILVDIKRQASISLYYLVYLHELGHLVYNNSTELNTLYKKYDISDEKLLGEVVADYIAITLAQHMTFINNKDIWKFKESCNDNISQLKIDNYKLLILELREITLSIYGDMKNKCRR
jgi:hypothetical protein